MQNIFCRVVVANNGVDEVIISVAVSFKDLSLNLITKLREVGERGFRARELIERNTHSIPPFIKNANILLRKQVFDKALTLCFQVEAIKLTDNKIPTLYNIKSDG